MPIDRVRSEVVNGFRRIVSGDPTGRPDWVRSLADGVDQGYFGPGSATWAVHGALPTLVGGIRALLLQALHPGAMAGVRQHSRYEQDALGRLAGTTRWLTVVTFGDTVAAERECARVRGMHRRVRGTYDTPDGPRAYAAGDPELLAWVHVAFTDSFLAAHRVWGGPIPGGEDAYVAEWATAGGLVGVADPPRGRAALADRLAAFGPDLRGDAHARETARFVRAVPLPLPARPPYAVLFAGAVATLEDRHREMLGLPKVPLAAVRPAVAALLGSLGAVLGGQSPSQRAAHERLERLAG
jgi:uncharacterized protein (DUF2236 family)